MVMSLAKNCLSLTVKVNNNKNSFLVFLIIYIIVPHVSFHENFTKAPWDARNIIVLLQLEKLRSTGQPSIISWAGSPKQYSRFKLYLSVLGSFDSIKVSWFYYSALLKSHSKSFKPQRPYVLIFRDKKRNVWMITCPGYRLDAGSQNERRAS